MSITNHTPTPWRTDKNGGICAPSGEVLGDTYLMREGGEKVMYVNAAFIVRACNAHDQLVEAAKAAKAIFERQKWLATSTDPEALALRQLCDALVAAGAV